MKKIGAGALAVALAVGIAAWSGDASHQVTNAGNGARALAGDAGRLAGGEVPAPAASARPAPARTGASGPLLFPAAGGDGDSWKDRSGTEFRLGLVNAPESGECFGSRATARRAALVASGFRVRAYATDDHGRSVAAVTLPDGRNLNVLLAREGYVEDRYLGEFRHENQSLARELDVAFAEAKAARRGLWGACVTGAAAPPAPVRPVRPAAACHPDYATCIPVKGDGSGSGAANDLDCPDIGRLVQLRRVGVDPYRLDADGDGTGCDNYG